MPDQPSEKPADSKPTNKFVLVAEDDRFYAAVYKKKLAKEGLDIVVVGNGKAALAAAKKRKPNLILLDLVMPGMDGFEALSHLKADPNLKSVKVIVLSNLGQEEDIKKAKSLGASEYLVKTNLSITQMINKVKSYLK